jgi:lysophospholipase L1-like esterase
VQPPQSLPNGTESPRYVTLYGRETSRALNVPVTVLNRAEHNSLDSRQLRAEVRASSSLRRDLARADIVTLTVGHNNTPWVANDDPCDGAASNTNDLNSIDWPRYRGPCSAKLASRLRQNISGILHDVRSLRGGKPTIIRVTNFHNDNIGDPTVPRAAYRPTKIVVDRFSAAICAAAARATVPCTDIYHAFNGPNGQRFDGPLVAHDHVHPNQRGHTLITKLLTHSGYAPLHP